MVISQAALLCVLLLWLPRLVMGNYSDTVDIIQDENGCTTLIRKFDPLVHKQLYRVAIYSSEGNEAVYEKYNQTFAQYLTATAGQRFDPPIQFDILPANLYSLANDAKNEQVDFFFASSSVFSCMATEQSAQALVTVTTRREARGHEYELDMYGGVMFTLADNDEINNIQDFKDRRIGAGGITMTGGGQMQFYEMFREGLSYVADPLQVMFTGDERKTVQGVLEGDFEIGFARTDQIERHLNENGDPLDPDVFKVINPRIHVLDDGLLFPFLSSTDLFPEWPVAALNHVSRDVSKEVQNALLALQDHATALDIGQNLLCETTPELAELARAASSSALVVGFRTARSYFQVRTNQEAAGFLRKQNDGMLRCIRGETLYEDVHCPEGQYKLTEDLFHKSCSLAGLECKEGYECFCKPCVAAFEVDVFQENLSQYSEVAQGQDSDAESTRATGCEKMSLCGKIEQTKPALFRIVDNRKRDEAKIDVLIHLDFETIHLDVERLQDDPYAYHVTWSQDTTGIGIMEIFFDNVQIPQSPIRVQVVERMCDVDFPGQRRTSTADGHCDCSEGGMEIRGKCVESTIMAVMISIFSVLLVTIFGVCYIRYRTNKNDEVWKIDVEELQFDDPVEVIGQGSFGVVLLAHFRGTKVALKRALRNDGKGSGRGSRRRSSSRSGSRGKTPSSDRGSSGVSSGSNSIETGENEQDPELGDVSRDDESAGSRTRDSGGADTNTSAGHSAPSSRNHHSLGFLAEDYGARSQWGWLFPCLKKGSYKSRFKEAILGNSAGSSMGRSWHALLCPWFDSRVKAENAFIAEMRVLSRLRHPCITTVLGSVVSRSHDPMLVMEYMEYGSLHDLLRNETMYLSGEIILQVARDVAQGLRFLHSSRPPILHGDMKARNILVDSRFRAKLCDFGLSTKKNNLITGTPYWLAPEYLRGQTPYTTQCDIYSMAIIIFEIYSRSDPYKGEDFRDTLRKVCDRRVNKRPQIPGTCPSKMVDVMKRCWSPDPSSRPDARDLDTALLDMNIQEAEPLTTEQQQQSAKKDRATGDMLYDLFPKHIADALKSGKKIEPEQHPEVTIVFSDIVHFTDISRMLSPLKVSQMLDRLYHAFDRVARKNNVFKVETIGDAYMGVTNIDGTQAKTHAKEAALFAIDLVNEASHIIIDEDDPSKGYINIRVGFHSGPVVSNVIGSLNPRYGLFGDTVNTSNRMESNSKANRILCSEAAYKILHEQAPEISTRKRGKIAVKGKGDMVVYWVGDHEVQVMNNNGKALPISEWPEASANNNNNTTKRVVFEPSEHEEEKEEETEAAADEEKVAVVDEHLWRRDLQEKLSELDSAPNPPAQASVPEQAPRAKRNVKEAVHMFRGSNAV